MADVLTVEPPVAKRWYRRHAGLVRVTHWINVVCFTLLLMVDCRSSTPIRRSMLVRARISTIRPCRSLHASPGAASSEKR